MTVSQDTIDYYDAIAEFYPMFFRDWQTQLEREGLGLRAIFRGQGVLDILDTACGVGTQSIPLTQLGYNVTACDPSPGMLKVAREHAASLGIEDRIKFHRTDFDGLISHVDGPYDAVICKGNALPHLIEDEHIETTLLIFWELLRPGGILVIGMRDFEPFLEYRPRFLPGLSHIDQDDEEFITFEIWEWRDGPPVIATQNLYIVEGTAPTLKTTKRSVTFRPLSTDEVKVVLLELGYENIEEQSEREEELLIARRPIGS